MTEEKKELKQCSGCRSFMLLEHYKINRKGEYCKTCISCGETRRKRYEQNKCEHKRQKAKCKECLGHPVNQNKCSRCKKNYQPDENILFNGKPLQTCDECRSKCEHGEYGKRNCSLCQEIIKNRTNENRRLNKCCHDKRKNLCIICNPKAALAEKTRKRIYQALTRDKKKHSIEYLGCSIDEFKEHIESQFEDGMNWDNHGEWHIDHIIPIKYQNPSLEDTIERLHWSNTQPLWAYDNIAKGNRFIG